MPTKPTGFVAAFAEAADGKAHPHLRPVNGAAIKANADVLLGKAGSLLAYQRFLAEARAVKAERRGSSASFERSVLAQAREARDDLDQLTGSALRTAQQLSHTEVWGSVLARSVKALEQSGPVTLQGAWSELVDDEQTAAGLETYGLSAELRAAVTDVLANLGDATLSVRDGNVSVESRLGDKPGSFDLTAGAPTAPANLSQLLQRTQFDAVVSAVTGGEPVYIEAVPAAGTAAFEPAQLHAFAVVAARKRMHEHVRKLEDGGLATYQGDDPLSIVIGALIAGLILGGIGALIVQLCDDPDAQVKPGDWICAFGGVLMFYGLAALGLAFIGAVALGLGWAYLVYIGFMVLLWDFIAHWDYVFPDFHPGTVPPPPS